MRSPAPAWLSTTCAAARAIARNRAPSTKSAPEPLSKSLGVRHERRAAGRMEGRIDIGEISDRRPMQEGAGELGGLDRILTAVRHEGFADENHARQTIEQAEFAHGVADI